MDQFTPEPDGNGSFKVTLVAVPVPAAPELETVTVKPTELPADTGVASAVFVMDSAGPTTTMVAVEVWGGPPLVEVRVAVFG